MKKLLCSLVILIMPIAGCSRGNNGDGMMKSLLTAVDKKQYEKYSSDPGSLDKSTYDLYASQEKRNKDIAAQLIKSPVLSNRENTPMGLTYTFVSGDSKLKDTYEVRVLSLDMTKFNKVFSTFDAYTEAYAKQKAGGRAVDGRLSGNVKVKKISKNKYDTVMYLRGDVVYPNKSLKYQEVLYKNSPSKADSMIVTMDKFTGDFNEAEISKFQKFVTSVSQ